MIESHEAMLIAQLQRPYMSEYKARLTIGNVISGKIIDEPVKMRFIKKLYFIECIFSTGIVLSLKMVPVCR